MPAGHQLILWCLCYDISRYPLNLNLLLKMTSTSSKRHLIHKYLSTCHQNLHLQTDYAATCDQIIYIHINA